MTYNFDISWDCPIQEFFEILDKHNLKLESYITNGPGGGNPEITVSGSPENIEKFKQFYN